MIISAKLINELLSRLKVSSNRGLHLNAIPGRSRYKFDLRLVAINEYLPNHCIENEALLTLLPLPFIISSKDTVLNLTPLFDEVQITNSNHSK